MMRQVAISDTHSQAFASPTAFMQSLVDQVNVTWGEAGIAGARIVAANWRNGTATIVSEPGAEAMTVDAVRRFFGMAAPAAAANPPRAMADAA